MTKTIKSAKDMSKTRTITMDDEHHRHARIIAANLGVESLSALFRYFIDKEWKERYKSYAQFDVEK